MISAKELKAICKEVMIDQKMGPNWDSFTDALMELGDVDLAVLGRLLRQEEVLRTIDKYRELEDEKITLMKAAVVNND